MSKGEGNVTKVVTTKEYYKDTGEITSVTFIDNKDGESLPKYTEYRETKLLNVPWKPKSNFVKMFTGGASTSNIPKFKVKSMAQDYLDLLPFLRPEYNTLGYKPQEGKWIDFSKKDLQEALQLEYKSFTRFFNACIDMNILSVYGRNNELKIYLNPIYMFKGRNLHIDLCLAFDHDRRFINALTESALKDIQKKKLLIMSEQEIKEEDIIIECD